MAKRLKKVEVESAQDASGLNLREMVGAPDEYLIQLIESGQITEDMIADLPQNHTVKSRMMQLQKQIKKELAGQAGLKEFRGNIMGALRWAAVFEWGVSKLDAMKQAMAMSDRTKDAQIITQARTAGEQILRLVQGGQAPQVGAPAREAQKQGMAIGGAGGGGRPDLATLIANAKKQLAEKAAKSGAAKPEEKKPAPNLKNVPVDPKAQAEKAKAEQQAKEAEQTDKQKAGG